MDTGRRVKIIVDPSVNSITVWIGDASQEAVATQLSEDLTLLKDFNGEIIGFEKHFFDAAPGELQVQLETLPMMTPEEMMGEGAKV